MKENRLLKISLITFGVCIAVLVALAFVPFFEEKEGITVYNDCGSTSEYEVEGACTALGCEGDAGFGCVTWVSKEETVTVRKSLISIWVGEIRQ